MSESKEKKGIGISAKSFITAIVVIFILMLICYVLTFIIPGGEYARIEDANGNMIVDTEGGFTYVEGGLPFWKWVLSPILVLGAEGSASIIAVVAFLLVIGGVFNNLELCGLMNYMLEKIVGKFGNKRYKLMAALMAFFMLMGALVGSFEEVVPLVPIAVALSINLGWDAVTGIMMSLLATGCGFASGMCNPFTVGVAQKLAGLPILSGMWFRAIVLVFIYALLLMFVLKRAKKIEKPVDEKFIASYVKDEKMEKGLKSFAIIILIGVVTIFSSSFITVLQDFTLYIVVVMFLAAGIVSPKLAGMTWKEHLKGFFKGMINIAPASLMILMASSIKYTLVEGKILDTILFKAVEIADVMPDTLVILLIYLIVLIMNFFVASGSAKAFMLIPIIIPLAQVFGISSQLAISAFAFGDGFSNVIYPTNAALLISLGLVDVNYGDWFKATWKFQILNLLLTSAFLVFGLVIGY